MSNTRLITVSINIEIDENADAEDVVSEMDFSFEHDDIVASEITDYYTGSELVTFN